MSERDEVTCDCCGTVGSCAAVCLCAVCRGEWSLRFPNFIEAKEDERGSS